VDAGSALREILSLVGTAFEPTRVGQILNPDSGKLEVEARFNLPRGNLFALSRQGFPVVACTGSPWWFRI